MILIKYIILAIVQGIAEFFPISSSFHINLAKKLLLIKPPEIFNLFTHMATAFATIFFLRKELFKNISEKLYIGIALFPLIFFYLILKKINPLFFSFNIQIFFLLITCSFLFFIPFLKDTQRENSTKTKILDMLFIGFMQGFALFPGISRSAITIFAAKCRGWDIKKAILFSFLLSIPTIFAGIFIEGYKFFQAKEIINIDLCSLIITFFTSFFIGCFTINVIFSIKSKRQMVPFAWYCFALAIICFGVSFFKKGF